MADPVELKNAAARLRQWAKEIRLENMPAPYAGADEDIATLEKVGALLDEAADEILRFRDSPSKE
jgi:hypothetical protein